MVTSCPSSRLVFLIGAVAVTKSAPQEFSVSPARVEIGDRQGKPLAVEDVPKIKLSAKIQASGEAKYTYDLGGPTITLQGT